MEDHKHHGGTCGDCVSSCMSGHKFVWLRILLGILLITFVFCAGMLIGRIDSSYGGRHQRGGMYGSNYGYRMLGGTQPMMFEVGAVKAVTTPATVK